MVTLSGGRTRPPRVPAYGNAVPSRPYGGDNKYALKPVGARTNLAALPFLVIGFSVGWLMSTILTPDLMSMSADSDISPVQSGYVHDVFSRQGISYIGFHAKELKLRLASLVHKTGKVVVAGVKHEGEVQFMAQAGYEIYAFEPLQRHYEAIRKLSERRPHWMVHLHKVVLGNRSGGTVKLSRGGENVHRAQIDDYIAPTEEIDVLSVDIQGNELEVLQGAKKLLENGSIRSLWIEIMGCNKKSERLLKLLEKDYIIFDLVPWGARRTAVGRMEAMGNGTLTNRPHKHINYLWWLCANGKESFKWVQTDIVAVRKDLVTRHLLQRFSTIANDAFVASLYEMKEIIFSNKRKRST